jgi:uncharacterized protein (TIGR02145 family)
MILYFRNIWDNLKQDIMKRLKSILVAGILLLSFAFGNSIITNGSTQGSTQQKPASKTVQTKSSVVQTKSSAAQTKQVKPKSTQISPKTIQSKPKTAQPKIKTTKSPAKPAVPAKPRDPNVITIGTQNWAIANLDVAKFRNGDSIPEAKTNEEWVKAGEMGKPVWCYYNNDPVIGKKYGKLYNWYAINDPRGLAPSGWSIPGDEDWVLLTNFLGGPGVAGTKLKSVKGWSEDYNGTNETGFAGLPGGYRVENGKFMNLGTIATWWSATESRADNAIDHYLVQSGNFPKSNNSKQRGEYVRCIKK